MQVAPPRHSDLGSCAGASLPPNKQPCNSDLNAVPQLIDVSPVWLECSQQERWALVYGYIIRLKHMYSKVQGKLGD